VRVYGRIYAYVCPPPHTYIYLHIYMPVTTYIPMYTTYLCYSDDGLNTPRLLMASQCWTQAAALFPQLHTVHNERGNVLVQVDIYMRV
jgi:hypothetical protein